MMRITQSMISQNMLKNISNSYSQIDKYMDQLSTGKRLIALPTIQSLRCVE